jgi:ABC-type multidrug transport system fused ATPase/permease subunit
VIDSLVDAVERLDKVIKESCEDLSSLETTQTDQVNALIRSSLESLHEPKCVNAEKHSSEGSGSFNSLRTTQCRSSLDNLVSVKLPLTLTASPKTGTPEKQSLNTQSTSLSIYFKYLFSGGSVWFWGLILFTVLLSQFLLMASEMYLAAWCTDANRYQSPLQSILIYCTLVAVGGALFFYRCHLISLATVETSRTVHDALFEGVKRSPQAFFDTHAIGQIIGRFSRDSDLIDNELPGVIQDVAACSVASLSTLFLVMFLTPAAIPAIIPIAWLYLRIQKHYLPASRNLKRLESSSRSPISSFVSETCNGLVTIRAYDRVDIESKKALKCCTQKTRYIATWLYEYVYEMLDFWNC